eukprot:scaffold12038_cov143-Skeletonema_marinoi.AAC.1
MKRERNPIDEESRWNKRIECYYVNSSPFLRLLLPTYAFKGHHARGTGVGNRSEQAEWANDIQP